MLEELAVAIGALVSDHSNESEVLHVVLFNILDKVILTFKSVDETLVCDQSYESY